MSVQIFIFRIILKNVRMVYMLNFSQVQLLLLQEKPMNARKLNIFFYLLLKFWNWSFIPNFGIKIKLMTFIKQIGNKYGKMNQSLPLYVIFHFLIKNCFFFFCLVQLVISYASICHSPPFWENGQQITE